MIFTKMATASFFQFVHEKLQLICYINKMRLKYNDIIFHLQNEKSHPHDMNLILKKGVSEQ